MHRLIMQRRMRLGYILMAYSSILGSKRDCSTNRVGFMMMGITGARNISMVVVNDISTTMNP